MIVAIVLTMLLLLAACGGSKIKAKPLSSRSPTGAAVLEPSSEPATTSAPAAPVEESAPAEESSDVTAADAIQDLQQNIQETNLQDNTANFYPQAPEGVEGHDALKARTKLLMQQTVDIDLGIEADQKFGSRFDDLPDDYDNDQSAGE